MDFFNQGIPLGRWFGITVVIHWTFLLYAANEIFRGSERSGIGLSVLYIVLLFSTVLLHEFGHALACKAVGGEAIHIVLWPLGGIAFVRPPMNPWAWLVTTACGPLVNAILWPVFWALHEYVLPQVHWRGSVLGHIVVMSCILMEYINKGLLLFNLIPAYPMDGGRLLQEFLWIFIGYGRSLMIAGMVGTVAGVGFILLGLGLQEIHVPLVNFDLGSKGEVDVMLAVIGLLCAMQSFAIYQRSQEIAGWKKN